MLQAPGRRHGTRQHQGRSVRGLSKVEREHYGQELNELNVRTGWQKT